jgi:hypothetical protein
MEEQRIVSQIFVAAFFSWVNAERTTSTKWFKKPCASRCQENTGDPKLFMRKLSFDLVTHSSFRPLTGNANLSKPGGNYV